jgi:polysaccharide pyruvyl transferase WcaK-like protein
LDFVVGMMLHVGVMAFGAGTPEISVAYDLRNHSFADFIGHPELVVDLKDLKTGELLKRIFSAQNNDCQEAR